VVDADDLGSLARDRQRDPAVPDAVLEDGVVLARRADVERDVLDARPVGRVVVGRVLEVRARADLELEVALLSGASAQYRPERFMCSIQS
jgi:hypothetical protein